jgi:pimeloyl-ACP methyl ester carboxylesterase
LARWLASRALPGALASADGWEDPACCAHFADFVAVQSRRAVAEPALSHAAVSSLVNFPFASMGEVAFAEVGRLQRCLGVLPSPRATKPARDDGGEKRSGQGTTGDVHQEDPPAPASVVETAVEADTAREATEAVSVTQQRVPTLLVWGSADVVVPFAGAAIIMELIPHATLEVVQGAGHMLPIERPLDVARLLATFWASL